MARLSTGAACGGLVQGQWIMELPDKALSDGTVGYIRPTNLAEALRALAAGPKLILAGGTDVYPAHVGKPLNRDVVDISAIEGLRGISQTASRWRIGGGARWSEIVRAPLPEAFRALQEAGREVGSVQIQNRATIAGNLCNASPAADGIPPLLVLDAEVELTSANGTRVLPLASFLLAYRKTAIRPDEVLSAVLLPESACKGASAFVKIGARRYLVISIVMAAARIERAGDGSIASAAIAVGAASAVAMRLNELERDLAGLPAATKPSSVVAPRHLAGLSPIDDVRAPASYRREAAVEAVREALDRAEGDR